jgi:7,8-dihydropterin-6-yl-methyl-4-(beta-D-ribofuranosyl)aminobenzene 5'-phosphate synthase
VRAAVELPLVDSVEILVVVDNTSDMLSSLGTEGEGELTRSLRRGARTLSSACLCCAVHGFACLVTAQVGSKRQTVLFDSGPEAYAFKRNVDRLGVDLKEVEAIVLSHGHWDHAGAMAEAIGAVVAGDGYRTVPFYAHPEMFATRGMRTPRGDVLPMDDVPSVSELEAWGASVIATREPVNPLLGSFYLSGEIPRTTSFEQGLPGHVRRSAEQGEWEADEWIRDERWLGVNVRERGLVVISACSHAGIINVLRDARSVGGSVHSVIGGLHLAGANERLIPQTVGSLSDFDLQLVAPGHCTGWRGVAAICAALGEERVSPTAVGKRYLIASG